MELTLQEQMVCEHESTGNDEFQNVSVLINNLLAEKGNEVKEIKIENEELKGRVEKLEQFLIKLIDDNEEAKIEKVEKISGEKVNGLVLEYIIQEKKSREIYNI